MFQKPWNFTFNFLSFHDFKSHLGTCVYFVKKAQEPDMSLQYPKWNSTKSL